MAEQSISIDVATVAAGTAEERYVAWPYKGEWLITEVYFAPATAVTAHATNFMTITVSTGDGAGGAFTSIGSVNTDSGDDNYSPAVDTSKEITVTGAGLQISQGSLIKVAKTEGGTGAALDGSFAIVAEKVP